MMAFRLPYLCPLCLIKVLFVELLEECATADVMLLKHERQMVSLFRISLLLRVTALRMARALLPLPASAAGEDLPRSKLKAGHMMIASCHFEFAEKHPKSEVVTLVISQNIQSAPPCIAALQTIHEGSHGFVCTPAQSQHRSG